MALVQTPRNALQKKFDLLFDKDPKEWIAFKPALGLHVYPCYSCRHMFYTKKSFQDHVNRRAILLRYKCPKCQFDEPMLFYNRCSMLLHCRKHFSLKEGNIDLTHLEFKPLPFGLAGFVRHPDVPYLFDVVEEFIVGDCFMNSQFYTPKAEDKGKELISLTPSHLVINRTEPNGESQGLALKQIAKNIPKCQFISIETLKQLRKQIENSGVDSAVEIKSESEETLSSFSDQIAFSDESLSISQNTSAVPPQITSSNNLSESTQETLPVIAKVETVDEELFDSLPSVNTGDKIELQINPPTIKKSEKCPECHMECAELKRHFLGPNRPTTENLRCASCKLVCPTACSYKAHTRIHNKSVPFVCPDCGVSFQEIAALKEHMDTICFHELKSVRYRCPGRRCGKIFASDATFRPHFKDTHIETLFVCSCCLEAFPLLEACDNHLITHKDDTTEALSVLQMFRCTVCSTEEDMNQNQLHRHLEGHCNDLSRCIYIYMCKFCKCYFRSVQTITTHLQNCKQKKSRDPKARMRTSNNFLLSKYKSSKCVACKAKMICLKARPVLYCTTCMPYNAKKVTAPQPERCVCILCKAHLKFTERRKHQHTCRFAKPQVVVERLDMDILKVKISENISTPSTSSSELDSPQKCPKSTSSEENRCFKKHSSDSSDDLRPKKRPRSARSKKNDTGEDLSAEQPISFEGTYTCRICKQKDNDRGTFHQHIKTHRQVSTAYQCMECGECFVVRPSLVKHLLHYHNISDFECYFEQNNCFDQSAVGDLAKVMKAPFLANQVKENQCKVCLKQCEDKDSLDKHFRIHGMALLITNSL